MIERRDHWGLFLPDLDPAERLARLSALLALARALLGPAAALLIDRLALRKAILTHCMKPGRTRPATGSLSPEIALQLRRAGHVTIKQTNDGCALRRLRTTTHQRPAFPRASGVWVRRWVLEFP